MVLRATSRTVALCVRDSRAVDPTLLTGSATGILPLTHPLAHVRRAGWDEVMELRLKRVYGEPDPSDGFRVLVDRLWPRGVSKERAALDLWAKEVAPSAELRKAFHQGGMAWDAFADAYRAELAGATRSAVERLRTELSPHAVVTLLHAVRDDIQNHAKILCEVLESPPQPLGGQ